ncbi:hypothetical protein QFZ96_000785 [Paraburkholderia youngii]
MLVKIASKDSETVVNALISHAGKLPQELYKSLTRGPGNRDGEPQAVHHCH